MLGSMVMAIAVTLVSVCTIRVPYDWSGPAWMTVVGAGALCVGLVVADEGAGPRLAAGVTLVFGCPAVLWLLRDATVRRAIGLLSRAFRHGALRYGN